jgi:hypothetical protein
VGDRAGGGNPVGAEYPRMAEAPGAEWTTLWQMLGDLQNGAKRLRQLAQLDPLVQPRPGYPHPGTHRSHGAEVCAVIEAIIERLVRAQALLPAVVDLEGPWTGPPAALAARTETLIRLASQLKDEALRPIPSLPPHAPPYLVEPPGHDLAGTKAVLLAAGIAELAVEIRNIMLAEANSALP